MLESTPPNSSLLRWEKYFDRTRPDEKPSRALLSWESLRITSTRAIILELAVRRLAMDIHSPKVLREEFDLDITLGEVTTKRGDFQLRANGIMFHFPSRLTEEQEQKLLEAVVNEANNGIISVSRSLDLKPFPLPTD